MRWLALASAGWLLGPGPALAEMQVSGLLQVAVDEDGLAQTYGLVEPSWFGRVGSIGDAVISLRGEVGLSRTGVGTADNFSPLSSPWVEEEKARLELDEAYIELAPGPLDLSIGKQIIAWGSLDGVRVTDTLNPVRLTEGLARQKRPDRIPIWSARVRGKLGQLGFDLVLAPDPTVNQQPLVGDAFFPSAPRLLGGLERAEDLPPIRRESRKRLAEDGTVGLRVSSQVRGTDIRLSAVSAPDHDGVPMVVDGAIEIAHPRRETFGVEMVRLIGDVVLRLETAWTPNAMVNVEATMAMQAEETSRLLTGIGVDGQGPFETYVNAQLIVDHLTGETAFVRPDTDVFSTFLVRKPWADDRIVTEIELISSLTDGDHLVRFDVGRDVGDQFQIFVGADLFSGSSQGLFGQYTDQSRVRFGLRFHL